MNDKNFIQKFDIRSLQNKQETYEKDISQNVAILKFKLKHRRIMYPGKVSL